MDRDIWTSCWDGLDYNVLPVNTFLVKSTFLSNVVFTTHHSNVSMLHFSFSWIIHSKVSSKGMNWELFSYLAAESPMSYAKSIDIRTETKWTLYVHIVRGLVVVWLSQ